MLFLVYFRRLLVACCHCMSDSERQAAVSCYTSRAELLWKLCWNFPFPGRCLLSKIAFDFIRPDFRVFLCLFSYSVLALWWLGGRCCWWPHSHLQQPAGVHQVCWKEWILECSFGESLCQVSIECLTFTSFVLELVSPWYFKAGTSFYGWDIYKYIGQFKVSYCPYPQS